MGPIRLFLLALTIAVAIPYVKAQAAFETAEGFSASLYSQASKPRGLYYDRPGGVVLVVAENANSILSLAESPDGEVSQTVIVDAAGLGLNHGVTLGNGYLFASSQTKVYAWPYQSGAPVETDPIEVVVNIPANGHVTRTLVFDSQNSVLYVAVGSNDNVDGNSDRARIRRFDFKELPQQAYQFTSGEVFADGLRNEVGLALDSDGTLWGVENGADMLDRPDIGGDVHNGNPAEEFNKFDQPPGTHYGYPYCFSTHTLAGYEAGTQFAWPSFMNDGVHTDEWCREENNNHRPILAMPAHQAPLGLVFYDGSNCNATEAFPCSLAGDAFVAFHGSWNSDIPVGYRVAHIPFTKTAPIQPTGEIISLFYEPDPVGCNVCLRPVNVVFNNDGHLLVSSDTSNELFKVVHSG